MNTARMSVISLPQSPAGIALVAIMAGAFALYADTARSIVAIWNSSETFAHGYVIAPISLWLIWRRRDTVASLPVQPFWPGLLALAAAGTGWLLAELAEVQVVRQYAFVTMLPLAVLTVAGLPLTRALAFPLAFLLLAVPFGEVFVAPLIDITANFTVWALQATGIPVLRNGNSFEIPTGSWSVVEACSGVRYLISSFTLGCLYAYLSYRTPVRRALFVLLSIVMPIVANGVRAYLIVMIGHLSDYALAAGVDHLVYGWLFFGMVMFLMFWIGSRWREGDDMPGTRPVASQAAAAPVRTQLAAAAAAFACIAVWPWYARTIDQASHDSRPVRFESFSTQWQEAPAFTGWTPGYTRPTAQFSRIYTDGRAQVGLSVLFYRNQGEGSTLIGSANRLVKDGEKRWLQVASARRDEHVGGRNMALREATIRGQDGNLLVWSWYWIGGRFLASDYGGKLLQAREKLLMRGDDGAALLLSAPYDERQEDARAAMRAFMEQNLPGLEAALLANSR